MKLKPTLTFIFVSLLLSFNYSCNDDNDDQEIEKRVPVMHVEAVSSIDLTERQDWTFRFGSEWGEPSYDFVIIDKKSIVATPQKGKGKYFFSEQYKEGDLPHAGLIFSLSVHFVSKEYSSLDNTKTSVKPYIPNVLDQSTKEGLIKADALYSAYKGVVTSNLMGIQLIHKNILIDFELVDIPNSAKIKMPYNGSGYYEPYKVNSTTYRIIYLTHYSDLDIHAEMGGKIYPIKSDIVIKSNTHYKFKIRFNNINNSFFIEDIVETVWSEEGDIL